MATVTNWIDHLSAAEVQGAIYPGVGTEGILVIVLLVIWIGWHVLQNNSESEDLKKLLDFSTERGVVIVPSRHFDGTNALLRTPINSMEPRYDEGSFSFQVESARHFDIKVSIGLIYRFMLDIDNTEDLDFVLKHKIKPEFCQKIKEIIN